MKKAALLLLAGATIVGCNKLKKLAEINVNFPYSNTVDLPGVPGGTQVIPPGGISADMPTYATATNSKVYVNQYGTAPDKVISVKLTQLKAEIVQPSSQTFDYIDTIRVYMSATGLPEQLAAYKYGIAKGQTTLNLDCADVNLKEYYLKDTMYFRVNGHFVGIPDSATKIKLSSTFNMRANPLN